MERIISAIAIVILGCTLAFQQYEIHEIHIDNQQTLAKVDHLTQEGSKVKQAALELATASQAFSQAAQKAFQSIAAN